MRFHLLVFLALLCISSTCLAQEKPFLERYYQTRFSDVQIVSDLANAIEKITQDPGEQLTLLMHWTYQHMQADSLRFFGELGAARSANTAFRQRRGLCAEYADILDLFCAILRIPSMRVEGYVKEEGREKATKLTHVNHAWNVVQINGSWKPCDLFWSTVELGSSEGVKHFRSRLKESNFLASPQSFIKHHLPADPVFQLLEQPVSVAEFLSGANSVAEVDSLRSPLAFNDSLARLVKMSVSDRAVTIAEHAYAYNPDNYNLLLIEYYNYGLALMRKPKISNAEIDRGSTYFRKVIKLLQAHKDAEGQGLITKCEQNLQTLAARRSIKR